MKYSLAFCSAFIANMAMAEPLAALVTFSSSAVTAEGVSKHIQFQDLLIRDKRSVWSQRVLPAQHSADDHQGPHQHHHDLNFSLAGRWIELDSNNQIRFRLVRTQAKTIIEPRANEYGTLGFDGNWEEAYYQVNRAALKDMQLLQKSAPQNALWYEKRDAKSLTRILWDTKHEIPLAIESASLDGAAQRKITYKLVDLPATLPWESLSGYQTIAYEDLLD